MKVIWRIVKDSSPPDRMIVYDTLLKTSGRIQNIQDLSNKTNIPRTTLKRILFLMKEVELIGGEFQNEYTNEFYPNQTYIPPCLVYGSVSQEINRGVYIPKYLGEESVK